MDAGAAATEAAVGPTAATARHGMAWRPQRRQVRHGAAVQVLPAVGLDPAGQVRVHRTFLQVQRQGFVNPDVNVIVRILVECAVDAIPVGKRIDRCQDATGRRRIQGLIERRRAGDENMDGTMFTPNAATLGRGGKRERTKRTKKWICC